MKMPTLKILAFLGWYLPGYRGGGPTRTLANMVDRLGDEFEFKIVTSDRDSKDTKPYPGITVDDWNNVGKGKVFYISPNKRSLRYFRRICLNAEYDILYLNSFFSPFTIKPLLLRWLKLVPNKYLVIAPRGEFSPGSLSLKKLKKIIYIVVVKIIGLYRGVTWQASSKYDEINIRRWFGEKAKVVVAPDLPPQVYMAEESARRSNKAKGSLNILFLSRISREKNLHIALKAISGLKGKIQFNIYGPIENVVYWAECQEIISNLPSHIKVRYCSSVAHGKVISVMSEYDILFLPTKGENFGHAILEAFCAGCPVLISDQTPWRGLEKKNVGWDLPLSRTELFMDVLQGCVEMDNAEYLKWSDEAKKYGLQVLKNEMSVESNRKLFNYRDLVQS